MSDAHQMDSVILYDKYFQIAIIQGYCSTILSTRNEILHQICHKNLYSQIHAISLRIYKAIINHWQQFSTLAHTQWF